MPKQKTKPLSLAAAYSLLEKQLILKKSSSNTKKCRQGLTVQQTPNAGIWLVTGGQCTHTVVLSKPNRNIFVWLCSKCHLENQNLNQMKPCIHCGADYPSLMPMLRSTLTCIDHEPEHKKKKDGRACSHVSAVQLKLAKEIMSKK